MKEKEEVKEAMAMDPKEMMKMNAMKMPIRKNEMMRKETTS